MSGWLNGVMGGWIDGWKVEWMGENWMDRWVEGWMVMSLGQVAQFFIIHIIKLNSQTHGRYLNKINRLLSCRMFLDRNTTSTLRPNPLGQQLSHLMEKGFFFSKLDNFHGSI